jgi:hypothetical protein
MKHDLGSTANPVQVAIAPPQIQPGRLALMMIVSVAPIALAILMQKPALRQAIVMRAAHFLKETCQSQADFWQKAATRSAQAYNAAKL